MGLVFVLGQYRAGMKVVWMLADPFEPFHLVELGVQEGCFGVVQPDQR